MVTKSDYVDAKDASLDASVVILTYNGESTSTRSSPR